MVAIGLFIQIVTSRFFLGMTGSYNSWMTYRDFICLMGQDVGELIYAAAFWFLFYNTKAYRFLVFVEFWISLLLIDMVTILFLNPFELLLPKDSGFLFAVFILFLRFKKYLKNG